MSLSSTPAPDDNYLVDKVDDPLARAGTNTFVGLGTRLIGQVVDYFKDRHQAQQAVEAYAKKYRDRYGKIRLLGMSQDIELKSIYIGVRFLDKLSIQQRFGSQDALESSYRSSGKRRYQRGECQPKNGGKIANEHQFLYILGSPGAGKSTFLRRVGLEALKGENGNYNHDCIPVMIELKQFNRGRVDLIAAIAEELSYFGFPDKRKAAENYLKDGKLLLLFDGLDEIPEAYAEDIQDKIAKLKIQYSDNRFILSCRIAAYKSTMTGFTTLELADFDEKYIKKFIHNWFSSDLDKQNQVAEECWQELSQPKNKASLELAQTPLLLAFLCITYNAYQEFPAVKSQLYAEALDILLRKWDADKRGIKRDKITDIYAQWNINLELALLSELAYDFFENDELFFSKERILEYIAVFLAETEGDVKNIDTEKVLDAIVIQQGILVERAIGIYSFSHLTLQEYLTAKFISEDNKRIEKLVQKHLTDERWQEVFVLLAGIKDNADSLLLLMEEKTYQLMDTPKLQNLLAWVEKVTDSKDTDFKILGKRALAIAFAFAYTEPFVFVFTYADTINDAAAIIDAYEIAMTIADAFSIAYSFIFAKTIDLFIEYLELSKECNIYNIEYDFIISKLNNLKKQIPENNSSDLIKKEFYEELIDTWFSGFFTSQEEMTLSEAEIRMLNKYFYSNLLIINTKKAASRVKHKTWSGIESRMLLPKRDSTANA